MRFSHVINPFPAPPAGEHGRAQAITYAALRRALADAEKHGLAAELLAVTFPGEEAAIEPPARALPLLKNRVSDVAPLSGSAPYPLLDEILALAHAEGHGDYVVFTNMDICPQPYFYRALAEMLEGGGEQALVIPRRTISAEFTTPRELEAMYRETGIPHEGFDCFVFPRAWIPRFDLRRLCIGIPSFDLALILNLEAMTHFRTRVLWEQFLTFHLGDEKSWKTRAELNAHNLAEARAIAAQLEQDHGPIPPCSKFEFIRVWLTQERRPRAPALDRIWNRLRQETSQWRNRWLVRKFRRELALPNW